MCTEIVTYFIPSAIVKTELGAEKICLKRERDNYKLPAIASCQYIRTLLDLVEQDRYNSHIDDTATTEEELSLVFEWMEHDLRTVPSTQFRENSNLPKIIAKSVLSALVILQNQYNAIHTGGSLPISVLSSAEL